MGADARPTRRRFVAGCTALLAAKTDQGAARPELRFGLTPVFLSSDLDLLESLKCYLEVATGQPVRLVSRRTYQEITALLVSGQLDAAWICGYPFVQYRQELALLAVPVWRGQPLYQSYIIVDHDRGGSDPATLAGDIHAFSDPDSNSGYLTTRTLLAQLGHRPETFFRRAFFTYGHRNVVRAVASGLAQSGSVDGYVWEVMTEMEPDLTGRTRVFRRSEWLGFPPIACPAGAIGADGQQRLRTALLGMSGDAQGRAVLDMLRLDRFVEGGPRLFEGIAAKIEIVRRFG